MANIGVEPLEIIVLVDAASVCLNNFGVGVLLKLIVDAVLLSRPDIRAFLKNCPDNARIFVI